MTQRMKEVFIVNPLFAFHQIVMHDGDVRRGSPETNQAQPEPKSRCLREALRGERFAAGANFLRNHLDIITSYHHANS